MDNMQLWLISSTDSINLNSGADGFYLNPDLDGLTGLPEIRSSNGVNGGYDGGWTSTQLWDARLITIRGLIVDKDGSAVEAKRKHLAKLVGQGKKDPLTLKFVSEAGHTYTCTVRTTNCTMALQNVYSRQEYQIQLRADDPLIYDDGGDDVQATLRVRTDSEGFEIPFDIPLDISGGADPVIVDAGEDANYPVITMYGELHSPTIVNQTTNQQLQLGADLDGSSVEWTESDTATGNPISLTNSTDYDAPILDFEMQGNATQNGTPTPDAPIAVNTTTGENTVKITGKNLLQLPNSTFTANGVVYTANNGTITASGTTTAGSNARNASLFPNLTELANYPAFATVLDSNSLNLPAGTYTLSAEITKSGNTAVGLAIGVGVVGERVSSSQKLEVSINTANGTYTRSATITVSEGQRIYPSVYYEGSSTNKNVGLSITNIQLELGSTATSYEPYQGEDYEVNLGKNLFDKDTASRIYAYIQSNTNWRYYNDSYSFRIPCQPNTTYTLSANNPSETIFRAGVTDSDTIPSSGVDVAIYSTTRYSNTNTPIYLTTGANAKYIVVQVAEETASDTLATLQLEKGSQATSFAPYFAPLELAKIGTYQDRIYKDEGKWYIEKQVGKAVLDGTITGSVTNYDVYGNKDNVYAVKVYLSNIVLGNTSLEALSDKYHVYGDGSWTHWYSSAPNITLGDMGKNNTGDGLYISVPTTENTLALAKAWLANNPATVYYQLATPTTTEITDSALISQLEAIVSAYLPQGAVNISLTGTGAQGSMVLEYGTGYIEIPADVAVIDCKDRTVMLNGANAYNLLAEGSEFIRLAPGENKLYLTSESTSDSGYAEVKFKTGNLSI